MLDSKTIGMIILVILIDSEDFLFYLDLYLYIYLIKQPLNPKK